MRRIPSTSRTGLICLIVCLSLFAQSLLPGSVGASHGRGNSKPAKPVRPTPAKPVQQVTDAQPADLPDLDAARSLPSYEPVVVDPVPSTRRRCTPRKPRCNDDLDGRQALPSATPTTITTPFPTQTPATSPAPAQTLPLLLTPARLPGQPPSATPAPTPLPLASPTPAGQAALPPLASLNARSLLAAVRPASSGEQPWFDIQLLNYYGGSGYAVSDSAPRLLARPVAAAARPAALFQSASYSAVADFSAAQNPSGVWGYGYRASGGAYSPLPNNNNVYGFPAGMHT